MEKKIVFYLSFGQKGRSLVQIQRIGATGVMAVIEELTDKRCRQLRDLGLEIGVAVGALPGGDICPASTEANEYLKSQLTKAVRFRPDVLWLDHLRFEGHWEASRKDLKGKHKPCRLCKGALRCQVILDLVSWARKLVGKNVKLGYYAVPFRREEHEDWLEDLGQDHLALGKVFDYVSPMLYHRMLGKPVSYTGEYVKYLNRLPVKAKILPIIQVKDMPDDLPDRLTMDEIDEAVGQALTPPSAGVAFFTWDYVIEKGKAEDLTQIIKGLKI